MQYIQRELSVVCVGPTKKTLDKQPRRRQEYYSTLNVPEGESLRASGGASDPEPRTSPEGEIVVDPLISAAAEPEECIAPRRPRERRGAIDANTSHALRAPPAAGERMIRQEAVLSRIHDPGTTRDRLVWLLAVYTVGGIRVVHVYAKVPPSCALQNARGVCPVTRSS